MAERVDLDVAVVGAGPAGAATALGVARRGLRVALFERSAWDAPRVGESLAPGVAEPVRQLGLWASFMALAPLPSWGTRSAWGSPQAQSHAHVFSPYGCGWHVDRLAFDRMLAEGAVAAGARCIERAAVLRSTWQGDHWRLQTQVQGRPFDWRARMLVDATGRRACVARALGAQRLLLDRLVGVATTWQGAAAEERGHLLVETSAQGWWYSAPLPPAPQQADHSAMVVMLMTDADLCAAQRWHEPAGWQAALATAALTCARLRGATPASAPQVHCAESHRLLRGEAQWRPWLAVGDAALAVDPVSGSGVLRALRSGQAAAQTIVQALANPSQAQDAVQALEAQCDRDCSSYLFERAQYYAAEQRFATPFWQRREVLRATPIQAPPLQLSA